MSLGQQITWTFRVRERTIRVTVKRLAEGDPDLYRMRWSWREGSEERHILVSRLDHDRLGVSEQGSDTPLWVIPAPELKKAQLVSAQMAHRSRDKVFEDALAVGNRMSAVLND